MTITPANDSGCRSQDPTLGHLALATLLLTLAPVTLAQHQHALPLVLPADDPLHRQGFVRIVNRSGEAGTVTIHAIDDDGQRFGPVSLSLGAEETRHFNSDNLENGHELRLPGRGVGDGKGDWRLDLTTSLDIEPLAYIRSSDGFVTSIHDVVLPEYVPGTTATEDRMRYPVRFFNPGSNANQQSRLRLINPTGVEVEVTIDGLDDRGKSPPEGEVRLTLPARGARTLSARDLELGGDEVEEGRFGDGTGKWRLFVTAKGQDSEARPLQVLSLLATPTGHLTNLSTIGAGNDPNRGGPGTDWLAGGDGDDELNPGDNEGSYDTVYGSAGNDRIVYTDSSSTAHQSLTYVDLASGGITATIDGVTNRATIDKGAAGTDTIVDIANPLNAATEPFSGAFGLSGTNADDTFNLTLDAGQWMEVGGHAGNDRVNIRSGLVRISYRFAPGSVDVDLGAGRASNDGHGNVDTFIGDVYQVEGGPGNDSLLGSEDADRIDGGIGDDVLNPVTNNESITEIEEYEDGGHIEDLYDVVIGSHGDDRIVYTDSGENAFQQLDYSSLDTSAGITATINGVANRATVDKGSYGTDTIVNVANPLSGGWTPPYNGGFALYGTDEDDLFDLTLGDRQWMRVGGGAGNDTFRIHSGRYVRIDYRNSPSGIDVDLGRGEARNDGFGDVDTIHGDVWEVRGSDFSDVIVGSDGDDSFIGGGGNDVIDGGGGVDRLRFDRRCCATVGNLIVNMATGTATGTWNGRAFSYRFSGIEHVRGGPGVDMFVDSEGDDVLQGGRNTDLFILSGGGNDTIVDFDQNHDFVPPDDPEEIDDILMINTDDFALTRSDIIATSSEVPNGTLIDLSSYGGGTILLQGIAKEELNWIDLWLSDN